MKRILIAVTLVLTVETSMANAQQNPAGPPPPPPTPTTTPPPPPPPPIVVTPPPGYEPTTGVGPDGRAFPLQEPMVHPRYSTFSAGPGGLMLMFSNLVAGLVVGGVAGLWSSPGSSGSTIGDTVPLTCLLGGVILGAAAAAYQYAVWTNLPRGATAMVTLGTGFLLGFGFLQSANSTGSQATSLDAVILGAVMEAAFFGFLGVTHEANISAGDAVFTSLGAVYGFAVALIISGYIGSTGSGTDFTPALYGPAVGELAAGLIAWMLRPSPKIAAMTELIPLGITAIYMLLVPTISGGNIRPAYWGAALGVLVVGTVVTAIFATGITRPLDSNQPGAPPPPPVPPPSKTTGSLDIDWMPTVTLVPDTVHGHGAIPGLGVLGRF